jgi:two-component system, NarL family, sensor histidine kinase UhpB
MPAKSFRVNIISYVFLFLTLILSQAVLARRTDIVDSLSTLLKTAGEDTSKVQLLNSLSWELGKSNNLKAGLEVATRAKELAERINFRKGLATALNNMGMCFRFMFDATKAISYFKASIKINEELGNKTGVAQSWYNIGSVYTEAGKHADAIKPFKLAFDSFWELKNRRSTAHVLTDIANTFAITGQETAAKQAWAIAFNIGVEIGDMEVIVNNCNQLANYYQRKGNYTEAMAKYLIALQINEVMGYKDFRGDNLTNIGTLYLYMKNYTIAAKYYEKALKQFRETGNQVAVADVLISQGILLYKTGDTAGALKYYSSASKIYEEAGQVVGRSIVAHNMGNIYSSKKLYRKALDQYSIELRTSQEAGDENGIATAMGSMGLQYLEIGDRRNALTYMEKALLYAKRAGNVDLLMTIYGNISHFDSVQKDYKSSLKHYKLHKIYHDSILSLQKVKDVSEVALRYEFSKAQDSLKLSQALVLKKQELMTSKQRTSKNYLIAGFTAFVCFSFFAYKGYRTKQQLKLQTLRNKIASDLHDDVGSTLSSISIFSQMAQEQSKETIPLLESIGEHSRKMLDAMADIVWTINPENDQFEKIILRMRSFAYELLGAKQIEFRFVADKEASGLKLSMEARKNLYLIFKEATNNMVKYSEANKAMFSIKTEKDKLTLMIRDDGKGFDSTIESLGNGLKNMKKRAKDIGASIFIDSMPGNGTTIKLELAV